MNRTIIGFIAAALLSSGCVAERPLGAGFRYSAYGPDYDPGPAY